MSTWVCILKCSRAVNLRTMLPSKILIVLSYISELRMNRAATISLTQQLAYEFRKPELGVRVNTVAPGFFPSEVRFNSLVALYQSSNSPNTNCRWLLPNCFLLIQTPWGLNGASRLEESVWLLSIALWVYIKWLTALCRTSCWICPSDSDALGWHIHKWIRPSCGWGLVTRKFLIAFSCWVGGPMIAARTCKNTLSH